MSRLRTLKPAERRRVSIASPIPDEAPVMTTGGSILSAYGGISVPVKHDILTHYQEDKDMAVSHSAINQIEAMRQGTLSPSTIVDRALNRIAQLNPFVNAVVTLAENRAREEADFWDRQWRAGGDLPPLAGLPVLIKDNQRTKDVRTTLGSKNYLHHVPSKDAGIVARLRGAGAIVLGKTNIPEYSIGANTVNDVFGATVNPFDPSKTCGGSSGGSAVAVATDMTKLATGSDHGGSLRIPSSYCGVVGYRASPGVVPNEERRTPATHYSLQGPITQNVADAALMLSVIADRRHGGDLDPMAFPLEAKRFRYLEDVDLSQLRVAVSTDLGGLLVSKSTKNLFEDRIRRLASSFAICDWHEIDLTGAPDVDWHLRQDVFVSQYFEEAESWDESFNPNIRQTYAAARGSSMHAIAEARYRQLQLIQQCYDLFKQYDLLIVPCVGVQPFSWKQGYPETVDGKEIANYMAWLHLTSSLTVVGLPVITIPMGIDSDGMPFGVQLAGARYEDHRLLSVAQALELKCGIDETFIRPLPSTNDLGLGDEFR